MNHLNQTEMLRSLVKKLSFFLVIVCAPVCKVMFMALHQNRNSNITNLPSKKSEPSRKQKPLYRRGQEKSNFGQGVSERVEEKHKI